MISEKYVTLRGGGKVKVQEVTVRQMMKVMPFLGDLAGEKKAEGDGGEVQKTFLEHADEFLTATCGLNAADLADLYPSDLENIWEAFREVNGFFFKAAEKLGVVEQLGTIARSILDGAGSQLADSLRAGIQGALTTASAGLSALSNTLEGSGESA